jgi:hypothetical protein
MPNYCPYCEAPLAPTNDAFCGECRGQLDEAPPPHSTPAEIELRRKLSGEAAEDLTTVDLIVCVILPLVGLIVGGVRVIQGRSSGNRMLLLSGVMVVVQIFLRSLLVVALSGR